MTSRLACAVLCFTLLIVENALADFRMIEGTATYLERRMLPPNAQLEVELLDISRADAAAIRLSSILVTPTHQVPIPFQLLYDTNSIDQRYSYAVRAVITVEGQTMYRSTTVHPVLTRGGTEQVEVVMERAAGPRQGGGQGTPFAGSSWRAVEIGGEATAEGVASTLAFSEGGAVSGSGGCNTFTGRAEIVGRSLSFGPLAATTRACIPAVGDQERAFFAALGAARAFEVDGARLVLLDEAGERVMVLVHAP
jgi:putative lipoprotein